MEEFAEVAAELTYSEPAIPIASNVTGDLLTAEQATDPAYWVSHVRAAVRFADSVATLTARGATTFVELGPDPVLTAMADECLADEERPPALIPTLREGRPEPEAAMLALGSAHAAGAKVAAETLFAGSGARRTKLPTYPFQRKRYWLSTESVGRDPDSMGLAAAGHPLLAAAVEDPVTGGLTLTGRLSLATQPWLADHVVAGTVILPGAAFLQLALHAAERVGCGQVAELALQAPLVLPESGAVRLQVTVAAADEEGGREIRIHSRGQAEEGEEAPWELHAEGLLAAEALPAPDAPAEWPPPGAEPLAVDSLYDVFAELGYAYGPAFQGLTAAWKHGEEILAEVSLAEAQAQDADRFGLHPALLDAALHSIVLSFTQGGSADVPMLPFAWSEVSLARRGEGALRVSLRPAAERRFSLTLSTPDGAPVVRVGALALRPLSVDQLRDAATRRLNLLQVEWRSSDPAAAEAGPAVAAEVWRSSRAEESADPTAAARDAVAAALAAIQDWLGGEEAAADGRLAIVTERGVSATAGEVADPAVAAVWGLVRSAQLEHPGRFLLIDVDGTPASEEAIAALLAQEDEPQLALREGAALIPRAARLEPAPPEEVASPFDPEATVLVTGATGALGALTARHLAGARGAHHLLLVSRSGPAAEGAADLRAELEQLGAEVTISACDVADPEQLRELIDGIPRQHPLGAVFHVAGALDDATIDSLGPERLEPVFGPKLDGAWRLHELTRELDLSAFVVFSSLAGTLGGPGQGNYAAANAFCDALAAQRHAEGLPAASIAWGLWQDGMGEGLSEADLNRLRQTGIGPLSEQQGMALLDQALAAGSPAPIAADIRPAGLRAMASLGALPPLLSGLVRMPKADSTVAGQLVRELAAMPEAEREGAVLELVRSQVAAVLGHGSAAEIEPERAFQEMGFDSLAALELRNRLGIATGVRLPATLVFDYPNSESLAGFLLAKAVPDGGADVALEAGEGEVRELLASIPLARLRSTGLLDSLLQLAGEDGAGDGEEHADGSEDAIDSMDVEELIREGLEGAEDGLAGSTGGGQDE